MKNFIHIKSKIQSDICINGENISENNVDIYSTKDFYIAFFPKTAEKYLPCAFSFYGSIHPASILKIPYKNNHYDVIFDPAVVPSNNNCETTILNKKYNNTLISVSNSHKTFISITNQGFNHLSTTELINNIKLKTLDGYCILSGKINNSKEYLLIFNSKKKYS